MEKKPVEDIKVLIGGLSTVSVVSVKPTQTNQG